MINKKGTFTASGGVTLFYQSWLPERKIKAVVVIVHGGGDHSGRFGNVVDHLVPAGLAVFMMDLKGHGRSPGKRGHITHWEEYRQDLALYLEIVKKEFPSYKLFLFGHSMGAVIVLDYCLRSNKYISGVICTSPAIGELGIPPFLFKLARMLDKAWPSLVLPNGLVVKHLSRNSEFIRKTKADPLYHTLSTPRFGMEMLKTVEYIHANSSNLNLPIYLIHGTDDKIASIEGTRRLVGNMKHKAVSYKEYKKGYHELFNDLDKDQVLQDLAEWIDENLIAE